MKISDIKNEEALDALAEIIDPIREIWADKKIKAVFTGKKINKMDAVKILLKEHKESVIRIMAALHETPYEEYEFNVITGPMQLIELLNDPELIRFFHSFELTMSALSSGSATESTEETEEN